VIQLPSTSDLVQVVTGGAQVVNVHASWFDSIGTTPSPGRKNTVISSATTTIVVPAPAAGYARDLKTLLIRNTDVSNPVAVTVQHTDGTTLVTLIKLSLPAQNTLTWTDKATWSLVDATGRGSNFR
jgi:hypothetical protein